MSKHLIIMCGLPFSGKTTLAKSISKRFNIKRIDLDEINNEREIGKKGKPVSSEEWAKTYSVSFERTIEFLEVGNSVVYDATNYTASQRTKLIKVATDHDAKPIIIYASLSEDEAKKRLKDNRKSYGRYDVKDEDFNEVADNFKVPTYAEGAVILNYKIPIDESNWIDENLAPLIEAN